jgi:hypothetical protein
MYPAEKSAAALMRGSMASTNGAAIPPQLAPNNPTRSARMSFRGAMVGDRAVAGRRTRPRA